MMIARIIICLFVIGSVVDISSLAKERQDGQNATGKPTELLDEMMSMCQITGWLNETIEQYTCTQNCEAPYNYTEVLNYDYIEDASTDIGTKVIYKCPDTRKKVVKIENIEEGDDTSLKDELETECLYNGQWSPVVVDYGCTGEFFSKKLWFSTFSLKYSVLLYSKLILIP